MMVLPFFIARGEHNLRLRFTQISVDNGLPQNTIHGIVKDKFGFMWFGTWEGVCRFDGYDFKIFRSDKNQNSGISNNRISYLFLDSLQNIWVENGDYRFAIYDYNKEAFTNIAADSVPRYIINGLSREHWNRTHVSDDGINWSITRSGKELIQSGGNSAGIRYSKDPYNEASLSDDDLTDLYLSDLGILWVGTENGGVNKADTRSKPFVNYFHSSDNNNSISDNVVRAVVEDKDGNVWVGMFNKGISVIRKDGTYKHFRHDPDNPNSLINDQVRYLYCDNKGYIWIGTKGGLNRFLPSDQHFDAFNENSIQSIPDKSVFWIMEDHSGELWIGTFNGFALFDRVNNRFIPYNPEGLLNNPRVRTILEDHDNRFWVATEGGGITVLEKESDFKHTRKLRKIKDYRYIPGDTNSIVSDIVLAMLEDDQHYIWIGTNNGLCCLNPDLGNLIRMTVDNGFPDDLIMGLLQDSNGNIWVSHKKGITRISKISDSWHFRNYSKDDGLQGNEFSQNAYFQSRKSGKFYFGGSNGLNVFDPDSIQDNPYPPKVVLTGLRIQNRWMEVGEEFQGRVILPQSIVVTEEIELEYNYKSFSIEFAGLHYSNPLGNKYQYMLEGFDHEWITTGASHRIAGYSNLPDGQYIFKVRAANCDGVWNPQPVILKISVLPPWWRSWWAYLAYALLFIAFLGLLALFLIWREKMKQQLEIEKIKYEKDQEINAAKHEFFTQVSHELRTPLSLLIDPLEQINQGQVPEKERNKYIGIMLRNARQLQQLINQLLDFRKAEAGKIELNLIENDIVSLIHEVSSCFENQATKRNIQLIFNAQTEQIIFAFDKDKIEKIISNLISNAFKYTPDDGEVSVSVSLRNDEGNEWVIIAVADTGVGIPDIEKERVFELFYQNRNVVPFEGESSGIGLALTRKLVELHDGSIKVENNIPQGSRFIVTLPKISGKKDQNISSVQMNSNNDVTASESNRKVTDEDSDVMELQENNRPVILIVDDNEDILNYLESLLRDNYLVKTAENGKKGVDLAIQEIPDLVISDVMMPLLDGFELCKMLKTDERTSHIPVILLTAKSDDISKIEGYDIGADIYHVKPFNGKLLKSQIKSLMANRQNLRKYFNSGNLNSLDNHSINQFDQNFIQKAMTFVADNIEKTDFNQDQLASALNVSKRQLYRKISALTGQTVHEFITLIRMNHAKELLFIQELSISEVAYRVGFTEPANFSRTFSKQFGETPTAFRKRNNLL